MKSGLKAALKERDEAIKKLEEREQEEEDDDDNDNENT